jgi:hypothetical protein
MVARHCAWFLASAFASSVFAQNVINPTPGTISMPAGSMPAGSAAQTQQSPGTGGAAIDGARGTVGNPENQRGTGSSRGSGFAPMTNMKIQGEGIALPKGVGDSGKNSVGDGKSQSQEKAKDGQKEPERAKGEGDEGGTMRMSVAPGPAGEANRKADSQDGEDRQGGGSASGVDPSKRGPAPTPPAIRPVNPQPPVAAVPTPPGANPARPLDERASPRNLGPAGPTDTRIRGSGVATPKCMEQSQDSIACQ